jgi:hypothetical protein
MRVSTDITQGTLPFESNQSLMGEPVEYHHDLQSYFWLTYLITCNCASPFNMRRDWNQEIARDQTRQRITPTLITNLAEIKTRGGDWKQVVEDHTLDSEDRSARLMSNFTISRFLAYNTFILAISSTETSILAMYRWVWPMWPNTFSIIDFRNATLFRGSRTSPRWMTRTVISIYPRCMLFTDIFLRLREPDNSYPPLDGYEQAITMSTSLPCCRNYAND